MLMRFDVRKTGKQIIKEKMHALLPDSVVDILAKISREADLKNLPLYLVGGTLRDLILDKSCLDIDIVVQADAIEFARQLKLSPKPELKIFPKFKTVKLLLGNQIQIDFATARTETYKHPAALPDIEPSDIKNDLLRRDFTINSLALQLNKSDFGRIIDPCNGLEDIEKKVIRVLHGRSFIDDPTRILRAVRFEQRLGFRINSSTEKLIRQALESGILNKLSKYRMRNELKLIEAEPDSRKIRDRIEQFGIITASL